MIFSAITTWIAMLIVGFKSMETRELVGEYTWYGSQKYEIYVPDNNLMVILIIFSTSLLVQIWMFVINSHKLSKGNPEILLLIHMVIGYLLCECFMGKIDISFLHSI